MKTSEFKKKAEELGYQVKSCDFWIDASDIFSLRATVFTKDSRLVLSTNDINLIKLCLEYSETPISEREDEKKYTVVLPDPEDGSNVKIVLARTQDKRIVLNVAKIEKTREWIRFHLTEAEIKRNHEYLWQFAKEVVE